MGSEGLELTGGKGGIVTSDYKQCGVDVVEYKLICGLCNLLSVSSPSWRNVNRFRIGMVSMGGIITISSPSIHENCYGELGGDIRKIFH